MKFHLPKIPKFLKNKYLVTLVAFVVWVGFFDSNNYFAQKEAKMQLSELEKEKQNVLNAIEKDRRQIDAIRNDKKALEKLAREEYLMKRDDEDLFIIVKNQQPVKDKKNSTGGQ